MVDSTVLYPPLLSMVRKIVELGADELHEYRLNALKELCAFARAEVPFYARGSLAALCHSEGEEFARQWLDLKPVSRATIQASNEDFVALSLPASHGERFEETTSGSTGTPLKCIASNLEECIFEVTDYYLHNDVYLRDVCSSFLSIKSLPVHRLPADQLVELDAWGRVPKSLGQLGPCWMLNVATPVDRQIDWIIALKPKHLATMPSNLQQLLPELEQLSARRGIEVDELLTYGETLSESLRESTLRRIGKTICDCYSATEAGVLAFQCSRVHQNYHIMSPTVHVEILAEDGSLCKPGQAGRIVATPLYKYAMPLIRYELGDYAVAGGPCACGSPLPTINRILGRQRNLFKFPNGAVIWPALDSYQLRRFVPFVSCQVAQTGPLAIELRIVPASGSSGDLPALTAYIRTVFDQPVVVTIRRVERIKSYESAKFEDYVREF